MSNSNSNSSSSGIGFCGLLTIVLITLKLLGKIGWAWHWVLAPLWMPISVILGICVIVFIGYIIYAIWPRPNARHRINRGW